MKYYLQPNYIKSKNFQSPVDPMKYRVITQSLQYQITQQAAVKIQRNLPLVHKKVFTFELNANIEPPGS